MFLALSMLAGYSGAMGEDAYDPTSTLALLTGLAAEAGQSA
jgi:hypothetical protein